jgi:hypothetical protein
VEEDSVVVVLVVVAAGTPEVEVQGLAVATSAVDEDSVVVPRTTMAEACVSLIRAPGSFVLRVADRPRLPDRIAG